MQGHSLDSEAGGQPQGAAPTHLGPPTVLPTFPLRGQGGAGAVGTGLAGGFWGRAGKDRQVTPRQGHRNRGRQWVLRPGEEVEALVKPGPSAQVALPAEQG